MKSFFLKKEDIKLPDYYTVTFYPISDLNNPRVYKVASHAMMTCAIEYKDINLGKDKDGNTIIERRPVKYQTQRAVELYLYGEGDRRRIVIGLDQGILEFSKEFDEIVELKKLRDQKKQAEESVKK